MRKIEYTQIWAMELWLTCNTAEMMMNQFFNDNPEITWLRDEGYKPTIVKTYNHQTQNVEVNMVFRVPDEIISYLLLRFTDDKTELEIYE